MLVGNGAGDTMFRGSKNTSNTYFGASSIVNRAYLGVCFLFVPDLWASWRV